MVFFFAKKIHNLHLLLSLVVDGRLFIAYVISKELEIPKSKRGELYFADDDEMVQYGGTTYMPFEDTCYYDECNDILCIGNFNKGGETVEFAANTYAVINQNDLVAVFMKIWQLPETVIIRKGRFYK